MEDTHLDFTVFTATFNRAHTLVYVYESLANQTFRNFEWIIVDDGSSDNTSSLVKSWQQKAPFTIRYYYQENRGKPSAHNWGLREARGRLFLVLDSDDRCVPEALERLKFHWDSIPQERQSLFSGVAVLCKNLDGKIVGDRFRGIIDDNSFKVNAKGEKWGFHRTDILQQFSFPEIPGEKYIPEGLVWNRIGQNFLVRHVDEPLRIYIPNSDGITSHVVRVLASNPMGTKLYYSEYVKLPIGTFRKIKAYANLFRYSWHSGSSWRQLVNEVGPSKYFIISIIVGFAACLFDRYSGRLNPTVKK